MNIKKLTYKLLTATAMLMVTACADNEQIVPDSINGAEMTGISATMTRAVNVAELKDYVGKKEFDNNDRAVFVTIKRTDNAIDLFTYKDIEFVCAASKSDAGVTSIGWTRDKEKGTGGGTTNPDRIYWSDATNPHTFTGFCAPQQGTEPPFDWTKKTVGGIEAYYGSIGDPTVYSSSHEDAGHLIDFRSTFDAEGHETLSGNVELCRNDILLTHSTQITAQDAIAKLYFHHGLAQVRVIVNISDFAEGGGADTLSRVSDMVLKDMLTMYKWKQNSVATEKLTENDQETLNEIYTTTNKPAYNQRKDFNLWIPEPKGVGYKSSRTFTFYGMVVPTTSDQPLSFSFMVKYPDPMNPWTDAQKKEPNMKEHTYNASISGIHFDSGKCTTISISLNHKNEKMTVGAEYDDWEFIDTPDQGSLKKNSTFLYSTERENVTIHGDENATVDDATWLYVDGTEIKDVYGNDGSAAHPFTISTADQLLSFAYEVKGGFDFTGYTISLDAGITLQNTAKRTKQEIKDQNSDEYKAASDAISWIGIGDTDKPFNGTFMGGMRFISRLYGKPFFIELGPDALVEQLILESVIDILGDGGFAEINKGQICACKVDGNVKSEGEKPVGSFVGINSGLIFACYHIGDLTANKATAVGGLVGTNEHPGKIVACYNAGRVTAHARVTPYGVLGSGGNGSEISVIGCFYDKTKATVIANVAPQTTMSPRDYPSKGISTAELMRSSFVGDPDPENTDVECLNGIINHWVGEESHSWASQERLERLKSHHYFAQPAKYPQVY